jgi:hypothetical protein
MSRNTVPKITACGSENSGMNKSRAEGALTCSRDDKVQWNPAGPTCPWRLLPEAPPPAATDKLRLVQLRTFARRFACGDLRLMPTPLDRYASPKHRVTDGAWLALATGNDLEILIALEAIADDVGDLRWRYSLGRMNASGMQVRLDDR